MLKGCLLKQPLMTETLKEIKVVKDIFAMTAPI